MNRWDELPDKSMDELFSAYCDGELNARESARAEELLSLRDEHRQTLEEIQAVGRDMRALARHQLGDQFARRVLAAAHQLKPTLTTPLVSSPEQRAAAYLLSATSWTRRFGPPPSGNEAARDPTRH